MKLIGGAYKIFELNNHEVPYGLHGISMVKCSVLVPKKRWENYYAIKIIIIEK